MLHMLPSHASSPPAVVSVSCHLGLAHASHASFTCFLPPRCGFCFLPPRIGTCFTCFLHMLPPPPLWFLFLATSDWHMLHMLPSHASSPPAVVSVSCHLGL